MRRWAPCVLIASLALTNVAVADPPRVVEGPSRASAWSEMMRGPRPPPIVAAWGRAPFVCEPGHCTREEEMALHALESMVDARWIACRGRMGMWTMMPVTECRCGSGGQVPRMDCILGAVALWRAREESARACEQSTNDLFASLVLRVVPSFRRASPPGHQPHRQRRAGRASGVWRSMVTRDKLRIELSRSKAENVADA